MLATEQRKPARELAAVLVAHWPYVRRTGGWREEQWNRYSAETVLPVLKRLETADGTGKTLRLTWAVSPTWLGLAARTPAGNRMLARLAALQETGAVELAAIPATGAYLPLLLTQEAIAAQLLTARRELERLFGVFPRGFVMPGGGTMPGVDRLLRRAGADYAVVGAAAVGHPVPGVPEANKLPSALLTPNELMAIPAVREMNCALGAAAAYVIELADPESLEKLGEILHEEMLHGITLTELYERRAEGLRVGTLREGSWEPNGSSARWLHSRSGRMLRHLHEAERRLLKLVEYRMPEGDDSPLQGRALRMAARELLLAQSGDWLETTFDRLAAVEREARLSDHLSCFRELCRQLEVNAIDESRLEKLERTDDVLASVELFDFIPPDICENAEAGDARRMRRWIDETRGAHNVFMLAWEYPPKQVGGLACAVSELSETLAEQGFAVHVVTAEHPGAPALEVMNGVYVHRVRVLRSGDTDFLDWTFEMNMAMTAHAVRWRELGGTIDLLHAHDWLVYYAARELKTSCGIPLAATIHATEWGRNRGGLHNELAQRIHELEGQLTFEAARVFVCSEYMRQEVMRLFELPSDKLFFSPNGVRVKGLNGAAAAYAVPNAADRREWAREGERIVLYIGRLVYEKGVQTLLEAMPHVLANVPEAKLIVAGSGPMEEEAKRLAEPLGEKALFVGFADGELKERLYRAADVVVTPSWYEPFGIVALEAMSRGKPLVVSDTGGLADIVEHGVDGFKALPAHPSSLAWHIAELLRRPALGTAMAAAAKRKVQERYDWTRIAQGVASIYGELLGVPADAGEAPFCRVDF